MITVVEGSIFIEPEGKISFEELVEEFFWEDVYIETEDNGFDLIAEIMDGKKVVAHEF